jgi:IS30 family transposase
MVRQGLSQRAIAAALGVNQSSISRERKRNGGGRGYRFQQAAGKAQARRHAASSRPRKLTKRVMRLITWGLQRKQWSPEQITGWLLADHAISISHERIYQMVWADKRAGGMLWKNLRRHGKRYNKRSGRNAGRGLIPGRIDIADRPAVVDRKTRVGDWEADTVIGKNHQGNLVTLVERKTRFVLIRKQPDKTAPRTTRTIQHALRTHRLKTKTMTFDNGKEFAGHMRLARVLDMQTFFATPYHSWERGCNENTNGLIRQSFPKSTDFTKVSHAEVRKVQNLLNHRPRKSLGFSTPHKAFFNP